MSQQPSNSEPYENFLPIYFIPLFLFLKEKKKKENKIKIGSVRYRIWAWFT